MAVNYASKYSQNVDERFSTGSLTNGIVNGEFDWIGVSTVNVYSIPTSAMNDYSLSGTNRYGTPEELGNETQEMTLKQDRSFTFTIDRKNYDDTMMVMEAGKALRRQIDEVVIPEVDTYRISTLVAGAPVANVKTLATTKENAYEEFLAVQGILDDNEAPQFGRVVLCTPALETYYDDWIERLQDLNDEEFVIYSDCIYHVISDKEISGGDIFNAEKNLDGTISYVLSYYNGGCGFVEAIETALERIGGE